MLTTILLIILSAVYWLLAPAALLRFYMQLRSISFRGALGQYVRAFTDWIVLPLRRIFKGTGYDWASLITAFLFELVYVFLERAASFNFGYVTSPSGLVAWVIIAVFGIAITALILMMAALFIYVIISFLVPQDQNLVLVQMGQMVNPWLRPIRRFVPLIGNIDLSPMVLSLLLYIAYVVLKGYLLGLVLGAVLSLLA